MQLQLPRYVSRILQHTMAGKVALRAVENPVLEFHLLHFEAQTRGGIVTMLLEYLEVQLARASRGGSWSMEAGFDN